MLESRSRGEGGILPRLLLKKDLILDYHIVDDFWLDHQYYLFLCQLRLFCDPRWERSFNCIIHLWKDGHLRALFIVMIEDFEKPLKNTILDKHLGNKTLICKN